MKKIISIFLIFFSTMISGQVKDYELGKSYFDEAVRSRGGFYDYSNPNSLNMTVAIWGYVQFPGRYLVPSYTTFKDLMSLAGGPITDAKLEDLRILRDKQDENSISSLKLNLNSLMWEDEINEGEVAKLPKLQANDIVIVPGEPRLFFKEWFSIGLSVFSALISLSILILNITGN